MKSITVLIIALLSFCLSIKALMPVGIATVKTCLLTNKVTGQDIKALKTGKLDETDPNSHLKCFVKCVFNKVGTLKGSILDKGSFFGYFESRLGKENTQKYYDMCKDEVGEGDCGTAFKIVRCLVKNDKHFKQIAVQKAKKI